MKVAGKRYGLRRETVFLSRFLAATTEEGGASGLDDSLNRGATAAAGLSFLSVNRELVLEITKLAVGLAMVAQGSAACLNCLFKDSFDGVCQPVQSPGRDVSSQSPWINPGHVERLTSIDIANASHLRLVENEAFDWRAAAFGDGGKIGPAEIVGKGFRPQPHKWRIFTEPFRFGQGDKAESSGIIQGHDMVANIDQQVVMFAGFALEAVKISRHAQMKDKGIAPFGVDQAIFRPAMEVNDARASEALP